jgi:hypothetical protein
VIDVIHEINATQRQAGTRVLEAGQARTITVTRTYAAELEDVWDVCTKSERSPRWFLQFLAIYARVGGTSSKATPAAVRAGRAVKAKSSSHRAGRRGAKPVSRPGPTQSGSRGGGAHHRVLHWRAGAVRRRPVAHVSLETGVSLEPAFDARWRPRPGGLPHVHDRGVDAGSPCDLGNFEVVGGTLGTVFQHGGRTRALRQPGLECSGHTRPESDKLADRMLTQLRLRF